MQKVYLSTTLPEDTIIRARGAADLKMTLLEHKREMKTYENEAPKIRPHTLEKYDVNKDKKSMSPENMEDAVETVELEEALTNGMREPDDPHPQEAGDIFEQAVQRLPLIAKSKARRLRPFLEKINLQNMELFNVLYDLTVKAKRNKVHDFMAFEGIVRQLDNLHDLPASWYLRRNVGSPGKPAARPSTAPRRLYEGTPTARPEGRHRSEPKKLFKPALNVDWDSPWL